MIPTPIKRPVGRPTLIMQAMARAAAGVADDIQREMDAQNIKASGASRDMEVRIYRPDACAIFGVSYLPFALQGRGPGKMPPVQNLKEWIQLKGISFGDLSLNQAAWALAQKIKNEGTQAQYRVPDSKIDDIIDRNLSDELDYFSDQMIDEFFDAIGSTFKKTPQ